MESLQSLNRRRKAVGNIGAITKAMEVVAAIKMRKAEEVALDSRPYAFKALDLLAKLSNGAGMENIYTKNREIKNTLIVLMTSDRGLIGSFNAQVLRSAEKFMDSSHSFIAVGKKAHAHLIKRNLTVARKFFGFGDVIKQNEVEPLFEFLNNGFIKGEWDRVITVSMHFKSALKQLTLVREILPFNVANIQETLAELVPEHGRFSDLSAGRQEKNSEIEYIFEPAPKELLANLIPHLLKMELYHLVLEANASEHAARYVAMKNASDNAKDLSEKLIIQYNKVRQAAITGEIVEMSATQSALA